LRHLAQRIPRCRGVVIADRKEIQPDFQREFQPCGGGAVVMGIAGKTLKILPVRPGIRITVARFHKKQTPFEYRIHCFYPNNVALLLFFAKEKLKKMELSVFYPQKITTDSKNIFQGLYL
jgi:hypothetical protein